jgi:hypothetical protein
VGHCGYSSRASRNLATPVSQIDKFMSGIKKKKHANPSENQFNTVGVAI